MKIIKNTFWVLALLSFFGAVQWDPSSEYKLADQLCIVMSFVTMASVCELVAYRIRLFEKQNKK